MLLGSLIEHREYSLILIQGTVDVEEYTFVYKDRYKVHLIDTPGFDDTQRKDIDVLKEISGVSMDLIPKSLTFSV